MAPLESFARQLDARDGLYPSFSAHPARGIEAEAVNDKMIVHNYGHGGSGWSLSWGCAAEAAALALEPWASGR